MKKLKIITMMLLLVVLLKLDIVQAENIYKEYKIGDKITYNDMDFYVIEASDERDDRVTILKAEPLTVDEVNTYGGVGTDDNHVNMYLAPTDRGYQTADEFNDTGYGGMAYYTSKTCGYDSDGISLKEGCKTDYAQSEVKYVVDAWSSDKFENEDLVEDKNGYRARLITIEDLTNNLGFEELDGRFATTENTPSWLCNSNYWYWTMSQTSYPTDVWYTGYSRGYVYHVYGSGAVVRPVVTLKKEPIGKIKKLTEKEFKIGDIVEYNNMLFYVIKDSTEKDVSVTLLKAKPLTVDEVNTYGGVGTDNNHVNLYVIDPNNYPNLMKKAVDWNGYGGMAYYTSKTCGYDGFGTVHDGCIVDYDLSEVKYVVDAWALDKFLDSDLVEDETGYSVRLLSFEDLINNLGYIGEDESSYMSLNKVVTPLWVYNGGYRYWTMSSLMNATIHVWEISGNGDVDGLNVDFPSYVRPVVTLKKINEDNSEEPKVEKEEDQDVKNEETEDKKYSQIISVPDTLLKQPVIFIIIGLLLTTIGIVLFVIIKKKHKKLN